jgi:hypothetical protein
MSLIAAKSILDRAADIATTRNSREVCLDDIAASVALDFRSSAMLAEGLGISEIDLARRFPAAKARKRCIDALSASSEVQEMLALATTLARKYPLAGSPGACIPHLVYALRATIIKRPEFFALHFERHQIFQHWLDRAAIQVEVKQLVREASEAASDPPDWDRAIDYMRAALSASGKRAPFEYRKLLGFYLCNRAVREANRAKKAINGAGEYARSNEMHLTFHHLTHKQFLWTAASLLRCAKKDLVEARRHDSSNEMARTHLADVRKLVRALRIMTGQIDRILDITLKVCGVFFLLIAIAIIQKCR